MPTYGPKLNGISLSQAIKEAAGSAPISRTVLHCFEISHARVTSPVRFVRNTEDITATLESTAPYNPSTAVLFHAAGVELESLQQSSDASSPQMTLVVVNVNGEISRLLSLARGTRFTWQIIERLYVSDDLSGPARLPVTKLNILNVDMDAELAKLTLGFGDSSKNPIPRLTFKVKEYPGLAAK